MIRLITLLTTLLTLLSSAAAVSAPPLPDIKATGYLLVEFDTGRVLAAENADERLEPASLTKIMTAHIAFEEIKAGRISLDDEVVVSEKAWRMGGSRMFIEVNTSVTVRELLKGIIIQSGNDASVALAEHIAGSEEAFALLMNKEAAKLGMTNSNFVNASGYPADNFYVTAQDIAKVSKATIRDFPEFYEWYALRDYTYNDIKQNNRNRLLWLDTSVDGMKTGHTDAAGYCLVSSAVRDDMRLVAVVMGTDSDAARNEESRKLLNYGFRFFSKRTLLAGNTALQDARIWKGTVESLPVGISDDFYHVVSSDEADSASARITLTEPLIAPINAGDQIGEVSIISGEAVLAVLPLVALESVETGGLFKRLLDTIRLWF